MKGQCLNAGLGEECLSQFLLNQFTYSTCIVSVEGVQSKTWFKTSKFESAVVESLGKFHQHRIQTCALLVTDIEILKTGKGYVKQF